MRVLTPESLATVTLTLPSASLSTGEMVAVITDSTQTTIRN